MTDLHSVHVDNIVRRTLERDRPIRHEIADELVELIHEYVRDGCCTATLQIEGLSQQQLEDEEGVRLSGWLKSRKLFSDTGALIATVRLEWLD